MRATNRTHTPVIVSKDNPVEFDTKGENGALHFLCISAKTRQKRWMRTHVKRQNGDLFGKAETREYFAVRDLPSFLCLGVGSTSVVGENLALWGWQRRRTQAERHRVGERRFDRKKESKFSFPVSSSSGPFLPPREESRFQAVPPSLVAGATHSFEAFLWVWKRQRRYKSKNSRKQDIGESSYAGSSIPAAGVWKVSLRMGQPYNRCWGRVLFFSLKAGGCSKRTIGMRLRVEQAGL